ncbi:MAG: DUF5658 family protein [Vicinamibacterales bacterium]
MFRTAVALMLSLTFLAAPALAADTPIAEQATVTLAAAVPAQHAVPFSRPDARIRRERPALLPTLYVSLSALQAYDVYSTLTGLKHGATEANPIMQNVVGNPAAFVALKAGVTGVSIYAAERLWKQNRKKTAVIVMIASNGLMGYVAAHNASVLRSVR